MKTTTMSLAAMFVAAALQAQDAPQMPQPAKEHQWLKAFEGEWTNAGSCEVPGQPPMKFNGSAVGTAVGGFWSVLDHKGEFAGAPFKGVMTIGYDPEKKKYVATWIDSMTSYQWKYEGSVDASGKILTLEGEGPCGMTGKMMKVRETVELQDANRWTFSTARQEEGKWITFMKLQYTRKAT